MYRKQEDKTKEEILNVNLIFGEDVQMPKVVGKSYDHLRKVLNGSKPIYRDDTVFDQGISLTSKGPNHRDKLKEEVKEILI